MRRTQAMATVKDIVVDCVQAAPLARFWASALDEYRVRPYLEADIEQLAKLGLDPDTDPVVFLDSVDGRGPSLCFQQVPEPKATKNRLHLDVVASNRPGEVERLLKLGAAVAEEFGDHTLMRDPEGNEFCVFDPSDD